MSAAQTVYAFVLLLGLLIFVHELGHFLVAKACGVRVLKFSLGFGPPVGIGRFRLRWKRGHTEYVVAWFPIGGFVKMLGENPDEASDDEVLAHPSETLNAKPAWQRLAILTAGPGMNLLLPVFVFAITLMVGLPRAAPVVGTVEGASPAAEAGLVAGDRITAIGGEPVTWWDEFDTFVRGHRDETVALRFERGDEVRETTLALGSRTGFDELGLLVPVGWSGLLHARPRAMLGIADADSPAHQAGLRSGDVVIQVGGTPIEDWYGLADALAAASGTVGFEVERGPEDARERVALQVPALAPEALGVQPANVLVEYVEPESAADRAGVRAGDLILQVDGEPVRSFDGFAETVNSSGGRELALRVAREGQVLPIGVAPQLAATDVGLGIEQERYRIGIRGRAMLTGAVGFDREANPLLALWRGSEMTVEATVGTLGAFGKLLRGDASLRKNIAGPIGIAEIAGKAMERGWETYLTILVMISINLAIVNMLPIPILDGGQALIVVVEAIKRSPLSLRTREMVQQVGVTMVMLLLGLAFWNDIARNWSKIVGWLGGGAG